MRILGIDPGFGRVGWGIIDQPTSTSSGLRPARQGEWRTLAYGCITTNPKETFIERIKTIHEDLVGIIKKYVPTRMAVEEVFYFKNAKTVIDVAQARGVIVLTGVENDLPVDEFTPLQVKQAVTGYGRAEKAQMQKMVATILKMKEPIKSDDAADALAVALCAGQSLWLSKIKV